MKFSMPRMLLLFVSLSSILLAPALHAQTSTAQLSGSVTDSSGAVLPHANVLIVNRDTGISRPVQTDGQGQYSAPSLEPGHYRITVEAKGFQTLVTDNVTLNVAQNASLGFQLKVGAENQTVTVDGSAQIINTTDASVSTVIDRKFVENIPLNGRSFQDLISLTPGVVTASPQSNSQLGFNGDFSVNGQRTESNYYEVDGVSGNISPGLAGGVGNGGTIAAATALGTTQSLTSVDALQEFRVEGSTYSAEYGRGPGGQFSFVTRSGTNKPHGSAFDYLRNSYFDANNWFNDELGQPKAALRQNDFGGTFGAPIRIPWLYNGTDKTFFFVSYEGLRLTQPQAASIQYVPDTALRANAASALQPFLNAFPIQNGNEALVPCTAGATSPYPCPPGSPVGTPVPSGLAEFSKSYSLPATIDSTSVRLDHTFGPKLVVFFRFGGTPSSTSARSLAVVNQTKVNAYTYTLGATSQFSSRTTNEFRLGYANTDAIDASALDSFGGAQPINATVQAGIPSSYKDPSLIFDLFFSGVGTTNIGVEPGSTGARDWNLTDTVSALHGHHQLKLGIDYIRLKEPRNVTTPLVEALYFAPQAIQNNEATELFVEQNVSGTPVFYNTAVFVQDEWKVSSRLNLSLGLRWEVDPAPHSENGNDAYTLNGSPSNPSSLTLAPRGTSLWNTYLYNFAPRIGAAWILHSRRGLETVFRTGTGVFFDTYNEAGAAGFDALGFLDYQIGFNGPLPIAPAQLNFSPAATPPYNDVYAFPSHLQVPYTLQWNASIEQALGRDQSLTISYLGANGRRLISEQEVNISALNPAFGTIFEFPSNITSNYQALQTKFQRTVLHGLQALVSYTWSHSIDFGSNYATFAAMRGNSDFDVRHNLAAGASWDIPINSRNRVFLSLLEHWGLDGRLAARTGFPITLDGNLLTDPATGNEFYSGVNLVPGKPLYLFSHQYPGGRALNGGPEVPASNAAFTPPTGTAEGDAPRNFVRGFGENQVNLAIRRAFPIRDGISLQFRAEAFNILNHPNFGMVDSTLTDAQFGLATQTLNQSLGTLAPQYQQGGPRSMQFALKLSF